MKLYTEEHVRQTFRNGFLYAMTNKLNEDTIVDSLTPIELPSDEEIKQIELIISSVNSLDYCDGFSHGIDYMKEQILNQNK